MNDKALSLAYSQAQGTGYKGTQEDFYNLLGSNEEAVNLAYRQASDTGYKGEIGAFSDLLGLKKKVQPEVSEPSLVQEGSTEFSMLADQEPTDSDSQPTPSEQFVGTSTASPEIAQEQFSKRDQQAKDYEDFFLEREKNQADRFGVLNVAENSFKNAMSNYEKSYKDTQAFLYDGDKEGEFIDETDAIRRTNALRRQASLDQMDVSKENQEKSATELIFSEGEIKDGLSMLFSDGMTAVMDAPRTLIPFMVPYGGPLFLGITAASDEFANLRYDHTLTDSERFNKAVTTGMIESVSNAVLAKVGVGLGGVAKDIKRKLGAESAENAVSAFRSIAKATLGEGIEEGLVDVANQTKDMVFDMSYGRETEDFNLYQSLDAGVLGAMAGGTMQSGVSALPSFKKAGHTSTVAERSEINKEVKDLSDSYFKEADPDIREAKKQKLDKALRAYDVIMEREGALNDLVPAEKIQQLTAVNRRVANIMEALESGKDLAGIELNEDQISSKKAELKQLTSIKSDIEQSAIKDYVEANKGQMPLFVEDQGGTEVEVKPVVVEASEQRQDLEEATETVEGQEELTQFDETQLTAEEEVDDLSQMESDFSEIDFNEATAEGLQSAGFSSEMSSVVGRVKEGVDKVGGLNEASLVGHKTENSLRKTVAELSKEGGKAVPLQRGEFTFGFVLRKSDGSRSIHLLDTNNAEFQERARENNVETPSMVDLVTEEVVTHYLLEDLFGGEGTRRSEAYNELKKIASKKNKISELISKVESEYGLDDAKQLEEEVIAAFFVDYVKNPSKYKSVWKQIADFFNSLFKGSRVITSETELMDVARNVENIISGKSVKIDTKPTEKKAEGIVKSKKEFTYLKDTEVFYDFNRQSDVEYSDWIYSSKNIQIDKIVPQKIKVKDFYHFRNWYNKITANQEFPGIATNMYFIKDGKKHVVNPPKPKTDNQGKKIKMDRIPTFSNLKRDRQVKNEAQDTELRVQYSELGKEVGTMWTNSQLSTYTNLSDFTPEGATESLDFEGQVIAKKNLQAAIDSGITQEQLKEMARGFSTVSKKDHPELFNMSGLVRLDKASNGDQIADGEVRFAKKSAAREIPSLEWRRLKKYEGDIYDLDGNQILVLGYDGTRKTTKGLWNVKSGVTELIGKKHEGDLVVSTHRDISVAESTLKKLHKLAADDLEGNKKGFVAIGFAVLSQDSIKKNPDVFSSVIRMLGDYITVNKSIFSQQKNAEEFLTQFNLAFNDSQYNISYVLNAVKSASKKKTMSKRVQGERVLDIKNLEDALEFISIIEKDNEEGGRNSFENKASIFSKVASIVTGKAKGGSKELIDQVIDKAFVREDSELGTLVAYNKIPYTVDENGLINLPLESTTVSKQGFAGGIVVTDLNVSESLDGLKFLKAPPRLEDVVDYEGFAEKRKDLDITPGETVKELREAAATGAGKSVVSGPVKLQTENATTNTPDASNDQEARFSRASGRVSKKLVDMAGKKGVSTNQVLQIMGKATEAERAVLEDMMGVFAGTKYIPKDDFDAYFKGAMLQQIEETDQYARVGIDNILAGTATRAFASTVTFAGREELYGTPLSSHFPYGTHAHLRFFNTADDPSSFYVMEMQSDSFQVGDRKEAFMDQEELMDEVYELFGVTTENMDFVKDIANNPRKQLEVFNPANITTPSPRRTLSMEIEGGTPPLAVQTVTYWWDMMVKLGRLTPEEAVQEASIENLYAVAKKKEGFSEANADAALRFFAIASLKAPIDVSSADARKLFEKEFFETEEAVARAGGDPVAPENLQLKHFYLNAWKPKMESVGEEIPSMFLEIQQALESEEDGVGETMGAKLETLQKYQEQKEGESKTPVDPVKSAEKSWERQLIREALKRSQDLGKPFVRFATEETAQEIQGWGALDGTLDFNEELAPTTYDFEAIRKRYRKLPQTLSKMGLEAQEVRDQLGNSWVQVSTPPRDQRFVMFSKSNPKNNLGQIDGATWEQRTQSRTDDLKDLWLVRLQDKYRRIFNLQEDVAKETLGQIKESEDFKLAEETMYGKAAEDLEKLDLKTKDIVKSMKDEKVSIEQLDEYLYALHAKERNAVIRERSEGGNEAGSGKTDEWADGILNELSNKRRAQLDAVASIAREIQQDTRNSMVELGLESQETIDAFEEMFENYIPLQGIAKDEDSIEFSPYPSGNTGFSVSGRTTKKAKGRVTESSNILAQIVSQNAAIRIKGRTNEALNALYSLVESNPNSDVWQVLDKETNKYKDSDPNLVSVRVDGVQKAIRFKDASYAQSLRDMNLPNTNKFIKFLGSLNSWLRSAFTSRNPEFVLSNFSRDIQSAIFNASAESEIEGGFLNGSGAMKQIFKTVGPALKALVREEVGLKADPLIKKYYEEFKEDGGKTGWAYQKSLEDIASELEIDDSGKTGAQKILGTAKGALDFIEGINDAFENSVRLSSYIAAREGGVSRAKSAQFAKNITVNFNKQGEWGSTLNAIFLFFNASVQGSARVVRSLGNLKPAAKPDGSSRKWYERATTAQKAAAGLVLFNGLLTLLAQASSDEDEDEVLFYNKIPDYVKERNMIIMRPDGKNYWKIPMPYGYNIFANIGTAAVETAAGHKSPLEATAFLAGATINAFSPVSFGQSEDLFKKAAKTAIPTALKPLVDVAVNETYFGGPVKAEQYPFGTPKPNSSMSFRSPEEVKQFFSWMNEATGGSEDVPSPVFDVNPDGAWYIVEYYLGGIGKFVERSIGTTRKIISDTEETPVDLDFNDIPMMRILYGEPSKYYDFQKFKDREVEVKQLLEEFKDNRKENPGNRYKGIGSLEKDLKKINKALKEIRSLKKQARKIKDYGERISKTQQLMERERKIIMMFNKSYDAKRSK
tara:strand:- start:377 stop:8917 length:8541 start_codon:yes stop_codon:yes gene_type:complete